MNSITKLIKTLQPNDPVLCIKRKELTISVNNFLEKFPGKVLYAVKTNPHPIIIRNLLQLGINDFDVASIEEMELVSQISQDAKCYFNHPIKSRAAIKKSYHNFNIRDFVIDHISEFKKLSEEIDLRQIVIQCRLNVPSGSKIYDFGTKFGMNIEEFNEVFNLIRQQKLRWALSFHVGSQCEDPSAYQRALNICSDIVSKSDINKPEYINVGGGFPGYYKDRTIPLLNEYFHIIKVMQEKFNNIPFMCEPGRAILWNAGILIAQVIARKNNRLYINDGVYGSLNEFNHMRVTPIVVAISMQRELNVMTKKFTIFGPTCDSYDVLKDPFTLPENIDEGDWLVIPENGAYSNALTTSFNGFVSNNLLLID